MSAPRMAEFAAYAEKLRAEAQCPGIGIGVARHGELVHFTAVGLRDVEQQLPITPDTVFGLGSIGKSFTCVALMQLAEAGKLRVDDPVVSYLPEFRTPDPEATRAITLHHLMTHTAGLPGLPMTMWTVAHHILADPELVGHPLRAMVAGAPRLRTHADFLQALGEYAYQLVGAPGELMNYSNEGYALLGMVVERVSGRPYRAYMTEHIFRPAGMTGSTMDTDAVAGLEHAATLYDRRHSADGAGAVGGGAGGGEVYRSPVWWSDHVGPGAGCHNATVRDMLRYLELFRTAGVIGEARILSLASVQRMLHPHVQVMPGQAYGYGLMTVQDSHGITTIGHGGAWKGIAADMLLQPETGLAAVSLANLQGAPVAAVNRAALYAANGLPPGTAPHRYSDYAVAADDLARYVGSYPSDEGAGPPIEVTADDGTLIVAMDGRPRIARAVGEHRFTLPAPTGALPLLFHTDADGTVVALRMGTRVRRRAVAG
jgi:CubicO group peptidase (beta-lactamase class C family)